VESSTPKIVAMCRMMKRRQQARFPFETTAAIRILRDRRGQHLDGDVASELRVVRAIDLSHPAFAELLPISCTDRSARRQLSSRRRQFKMTSSCVPTIERAARP
jgi:hypothetical protein